MDESFSFDEYNKWGNNLWLSPIGNGSVLSRLYPQSDVEADFGYMLTHRSVSECVGVFASQMSLMNSFCSKVVGKKAVGGV